MTPTFQQAADSFITQLRDPRTRDPLRTSTQRLYARQATQAAEHFGSTPLDHISNRVMKDFVQTLSDEGYSAGTISGLCLAATMVIESIIDPESLDPLYARKFDWKRIGLPKIKDQKRPCATTIQIEAALQNPDLRLLILLLASSGLRIAEAMSLDYGVTEGNCFDTQNNIIHIRTGKTENAARNVIIPTVVQFNSGKGKMFIRPQISYYRTLRREGISGFHQLRRYRVTWLRKSGVPEEILRHQIGHAQTGITSTAYSKAREDQNYVRSVIDPAGVGFDLK